LRRQADRKKEDRKEMMASKGLSAFLVFLLHKQSTLIVKRIHI